MVSMDTFVAVVGAIAGANFNNNSKVKIVAHKIMYNAITRVIISTITLNKNSQFSYNNNKLIINSYYSYK